MPFSTQSRARTRSPGPRPEPSSSIRIVVLLALFVSPDASAGSLFSSPWYSFSVDGLPVVSATGDVNGDGLPDLVVAAAPKSGLNQNESRLVVMLGASDGFFAPPTMTVLDSGRTHSVALADITGDGRLDVLLGTSIDGISSILSVLPGQGDGTFGTVTAHPAGFIGPVDLAPADLDGDGDIDVALSNSGSFGSPGSSTVAIWLNGGGGLLGTRTDYPLPGIPYSIALGDFNGDHRPDVVTASQYFQYGVSVLLNDGTGHMGPHMEWATGIRYEDVATGDLTGDGFVDIAVTATSGSEGVWILPGHGDGTFGTSLFRPASDPYSILVDDLTGDGRLDLVVAHGKSAPRVTLFPGQAVASPGSPLSSWTFHRSGSLVSADFNGDGRPDLSCLGTSQGAATLLTGNGDGTFGTVHAVALPNEGATLAVAIGQLNADPTLDLAAPTGYFLSALAGAGDGSFATMAHFSGSGGFVRRILATDVTGDGRADIVAAEETPDLVVVFPRLPAGGFGEPQVTPIPGSPRGLAVGDFDGDGVMDLVVSGISFQNPQASGVYLLGGAGDGTYEYVGTVASGENVRGIALGNMDDDPLPDLVFADAVAGQLSVLSNIGAAPVFGTRHDYGTGLSPEELALADLDHDGLLDVALTNRLSDFVAVYRGQGGATLAGGTNYPTALGPTTVQVADLNNDSRPDLAITAVTSECVSFLPGIGDGTFGSRIDFGAAYDCGPLVTGDLNGDGRTDIAVVGGGTHGLSLLFNEGPTLPTAIGLLTFSATQDAGRALVRWDVTDEASRNLYRLHAGQPDGSRQPVETVARTGQRHYEYVVADDLEGRVEFWLEERNAAGSVTWYGPVGLDLATTPAAMILRGAWPNPFMASTRIAYTVSAAGRMRLTVHDAQGRVVRVLRQGDELAGSYEITWDGQDDAGRPVVSGVYFLRLSAGNRERSAKLIRRH